MTIVECTQEMFVHGEIVVVETMKREKNFVECADSITKKEKVMRTRVTIIWLPDFAD